MKGILKLRFDILRYHKETSVNLKILKRDRSQVKFREISKGHLRHVDFNNKSKTNQRQAVFQENKKAKGH